MTIAITTALNNARLTGTLTFLDAGTGNAAVQIFKQDPKSRVAAETLCNTGLVLLAGEITTNATVDYIQVARDTLKRIGYDNSDYGIDYKGCAVLVAYDKQSNDIAQGVDHASDDHLNTNGTYFVSHA
jgi:S-adenosylmethionine synthetase